MPLQNKSSLIFPVRLHDGIEALEVLWHDRAQVLVDRARQLRQADRVELQRAVTVNPVSRPTTSWPRVVSQGASRAPMYPSVPVIRIFMGRCPIKNECLGLRPLERD